MASPHESRPAKSRSAAVNLILKEGFLCKKGGVIKSWSRRYFILSRQSLCYFRREQSTSERLEPMGRIFLSDIVNIQTEGVEKKKSFVFALHTKKRAVLLQASNTEDRDRWVEAVQQALESDSRAEREDPFRKTLRKLRPGVKRVTLIKDPVKGIGCTIKSAAGNILVNRIVEDGPIAHTGVLRPGDQILDIHGTMVTGLQVSEVVEVIKKSPEQFLATVRPITALTKGQKADISSVTYSEIVPVATNYAPPRNEIRKISPLAEQKHLRMTPQSSPTPSLEDVGNYDDEDEGDIPPPLPPRTEDALILVDPPPKQGNRYFRPPLPPKPRDAEDLISLQKRLASQKTQHDKNFIWSPDRPPMQKSKSHDDIEGVHHQEPPRGQDIRPPGASGRMVPRIHFYEEIQPRLNYLDVRSLNLRTKEDVEGRGEEGEGGREQRRKDGTLINVELDWRNKIRV